MPKRKDSTLIVLILTITFIMSFLFYSWYQSYESIKAEEYDKNLTLNNRIYGMIL